MPGGRPSSISKKQTQLICDLLIDGHSLNTVCAAIEVSKPTVCRWIRQNPKFRNQYAKAKRWQARFAAEEILEIADDTSNDVTGELKMPNMVAVNRAKLRIDARKWVAAKLLPKKYGDVPAQNNTSVNVGLQLVHSIPQPERLTEET